MIRTIAGKELTEWRRDGRVLGILGVLALLVGFSLMTSWFAWEERDREISGAQSRDEATFARQGEKSPHAAAHFGRMAYKPVAPLAVFDPGAAPYLGQVIWLEAHRRDPAMFRPAEDAPELSRLTDLSVAGVLTLLLPLLVFVMAHGVFAAERERGTLRQVLSVGPSVRKLFLGKFAAIAASSIALSTIVIAVCAFAAQLAHGDHGGGDVLARALGLIVAYALYGVVCTALALIVSARTRTAASALMVLLSIWAVSAVIMPRVAASVAERLQPVPESTLFWSDALDEIKARRPARQSEEYRALEQQVASAALRREVTAEELAKLEISRQGLALEIGERLETLVYEEAYRELYDTYAGQAKVRRWMAIFSPTIVLQHVSSALAGTDLAAHGHFAAAAEQQRGIILRAINEDMMLNGAGRGFDYVAGPELWSRVPDFEYTAPSIRLAVRSASSDFLILFAWSLIGAALAWWMSLRQDIAGGKE